MEDSRQNGSNNYGQQVVSLILVTGSSGFIGRHIVRHLAKNRINTIAVSRGNGINADEYISPKIVSDYNDIRSYDINGARAVIHCAAIAHQTAIQQKDFFCSYDYANRIIPLHLAKESVKSGSELFVSLSTAGVYPNRNSTTSLSENTPLSPLSLYASIKLKAERQLIDYFKDKKCALIILRPPLVHGPYARGNFRSLLKLSSINAPLPCFSSTNLRSFLSIDNLLSGLMSIISNPGNCRYQNSCGRYVWNISDLEALSTMELVLIISAGLGVHRRYFRISKQAFKCLMELSGHHGIYSNIHKSLVVDSSRFRQDFDWTDSICARQSLINMAIQWRTVGPW